MISARTMNAEHSTMNLPQMRSIWLDEDEEAEKLYGLQAQQFMGSDDEECLGITYINSDKPLLSNKKNIELPPLLPKTHPSSYHRTSDSNSATSRKPSTSSASKAKHNKVFFKLNSLKKKLLGPQLDIKAKGISTPFGFQHISHADTKDGFQEEPAQQQQPLPIAVEQDAASSPSNKRSSALSKAFVTERIPANRDSKLNSRSHDKKTSSRFSVARSISVTSSNYSKNTQGNSHSINGRVVSTSTMATSLFEDSPNASPKQFKIKSHSLGHKHTDSTDSSESSLDFLKNYSFPTLLEDRPILDFLPRSQRSSGYRSLLLETPNLNKNTVRAFASPQQSPLPMRRNSIATPSPQSKSSYIDSPANFRRSFDDILCFYNQLEPLQV
ncbi:hypothetical protein N7582_000495 [Saccharomyces uvarum]|uniref:Gic2p n=1 Tax=Saccharomyces uvarum TaxID=230603 RepID=A0AA35NN09_SACUV|nr:hypothetical protein N7582_000495 [Saccharomyces uvarum]CAI4056045.1 hypothetical protein SUVC_02G4250 [Saccharomyces uvarum]